MHNFEVDGRKALGFDTGLDSRAFAQTKLARLITEPGLIVRPGRAGQSAVELWKPSGVCEAPASDNRQTMILWGPPVEGERFDVLLNNAPQDKMFGAIAAWIRSILALKYNTEFEIPLWPCSAMFLQEDEGPAVFFAPSILALREVKTVDTQYVNPGLDGMNAAAFTAAAMLYRVCTGTSPFSADDQSLLHKDMRDGNFLPIRFAVPGLNAQFATLIQTALVPITKDGTIANGSIAAGTALLEEMLAFVEAQPVSAVPLVQPLSGADQLLLEKEKKQYLKINTASIKTKRFVARNTALLAGCLAAIVVVAVGAYSCAQTRAHRPNTAGMNSVQVVESYYYAIGDLDHQTMEACVSGGAGKGDIRMVINFFVLDKTRQTYQPNASPIVISAHKWQEDGKEPINIPIFGPSDLRLEWLGGDEENGKIHYRVNYTFWVPVELDDDMFSEEGLPSKEGITESSAIENDLSLAYPRSDLVTLIRKKGNWRISEIIHE
jgi:hypothetical protein